MEYVLSLNPITVWEPVAVMVAVSPVTRPEMFAVGSVSGVPS